MKNPFIYTQTVTDEAFCNREKERSDFKDFINNSVNVLLYSHRKLGKTSLIRSVFKELKNVTPIYIDLFGTTSTDDFIKNLLKGISEIYSKPQQLAQLLKDKIKSFNVQFSFNLETGAPLAFPAFIPKDKSPALSEVFSVLESMSKNKNMVVAFDEFQEVANYKNESFEKKMRSIIQRHNKIAYIFSGSQRHILFEMFTDYKRAFYKQAQNYPLQPIDTEHYIVWIKKIYKKANRRITDKQIIDIVNRCENYPVYIQEFFYRLWNKKNVTSSAIEEIESDIIKSREAEFISAWDSLSLNQKKTMKLIVLSGGENIYSADNLMKVGFTSASQVKVALDKLQKRNFVLKNGHYAVQDVFLKKYIRIL